MARAQKRAASNTTYPLGSTLAYAWCTPGEFNWLNGYPIPRFNYIWGPFGRGNVGSTYEGFVITAPEDEDWYVLFEFHTNLRMEPGNTRLYFSFVDPVNFMAADLISVSPLYHADPDARVYDGVHMTRIVKLPAGTLIRNGVTVHREPYTATDWCVNYAPQLPSGISQTGITTTYMKATLVGRVRKNG